MKQREPFTEPCAQNHSIQTGSIYLTRIIHETFTAETYMGVPACGLLATNLMNNPV